ncbi:glycosyltransferase [Alicyclobacillus curvatus]|nr:glycosyltransferase [Alicyclobacillus curvatus]
MINHWLAFGMSDVSTTGFQDTSRLMTSAFDGDVCYVSPPKPFSAWKRLDGKILRWTVGKSDSWNVLTPPLPIPSKIDLGTMFSRLRVRNLEQRLVRLWGRDWRDTTVVYVTNWTPFYHQILLQLQPKHLAFDCVDDVLAFPYRWDQRRVHESWQRIADISTVVLAVSPLLKEKVEQSLHVTTHVLPNGVDAKRFMQGEEEVPNEISPYRRRVGFAGTLNHWIDFAAIKTFALTYPDVDFFLMGKEGYLHDSYQRDAQGQVRQLPNVHYLGAIDYDELPRYLQAMDVLFLPRIPSSASQSSNPLKLYEYLATGKPIVMTGVPIPSDAQRLIHTSSAHLTPADALLAALDEAEGRAPNMKHARQNYALSHTWKLRMQAVLGLIEAARASRHEPDPGVCEQETDSVDVVR